MNSGAAAVVFAAVFMMVLLGATVSFAETVDTFNRLIPKKSRVKI